MKTNILISLMCIFIVSACSQKDDMHQEEDASVMCLDCSSVQDFITTANDKDYFGEEIFFIMGEVQEVFKYGYRINILEDLRGNYKDKSSITVREWDVCSGHMSYYNAGETLIMLIIPPTTQLADFGRSIDFETITCCYTVLKYANDSVTGYISELSKHETMLLSDLQELLKEKNE